MRLYQLAAVPSSLYWDEVSLGYNGWSISQNLKDEHGEFLPLTNFKAFGDYKPPVYVYLTAFSIKIFGKSDFAVRFPSAFFGVISVFCTYQIVGYLVSLFGAGVTRKKYLQILAAFFLSISPWAINLSRVAFEANVALGLFLMGLTLFLSFIVQGKRPPGLSALYAVFIPIFFVLPLYTFNSSRIFIPLISLILVLFFYQRIISRMKTFVFAIIIFTMLLVPLVPHLLSKEGQLRFQEVNIFTNPFPIEISNSRISRDNESLWSKMINNRRWYYSLDFVKHLTDNFRFSYLFLNGDKNATFSDGTMGMMYFFDGVLIIFGIYFLFTKVSRGKKLLLFLLLWCLAGVIPSGLARETPHALRSLNLFPTYQIIASFGLLHLRNELNYKIKSKGIMVFILVLCFAYYLINYYHSYRVAKVEYFQYGYKEAIEYARNNQDQYNKTYITGFYGRPYIYYLWYGNVNNVDFLKNSDIQKDDFGFFQVKRIANVWFGVENFKDEKNSIYIVSGSDSGRFINQKLLKRINFPNGKTAFLVFENR